MAKYKLTFEITGGIPPYDVKLSANEFEENKTVESDGMVTFVNLLSNEYLITVKAINGRCVVNETVIISDTPTTTTTTTGAPTTTTTTSTTAAPTAPNPPSFFTAEYSEQGDRNQLVWGDDSNDEDGFYVYERVNVNDQTLANMTKIATKSANSTTHLEDVSDEPFNTGFIYAVTSFKIVGGVEYESAPVYSDYFFNNQQTTQSTDETGGGTTTTSSGGPAPAPPP